MKYRYCLHWKHPLFPFYIDGVNEEMIAVESLALYVAGFLKPDSGGSQFRENHLPSTLRLRAAEKFFCKHRSHPYIPLQCREGLLIPFPLTEHTEVSPGQVMESV